MMRLSRRTFASALAATAVGAGLRKSGFAAARPASNSGVTPLHDAWNLYEGGTLLESNVTLPHVPVALSWRNWEPESWQKVWTYRRRLDLTRTSLHERLFLHVERAMATAILRVNGRQIAVHQGGFLPFDCEITGAVQSGTNQVEIEVDARWLNVPPSGSPKGPAAVGLLPAGWHYRCGDTAQHAAHRSDGSMG